MSADFAVPRTLAWLLTPPGEGALSVIRLRGPDSLAITRGHFRRALGRELLPDAPRADRLYYGVWLDAEPIDDVILHVDATRSDGATVDINTHGGIRVVERVLMSLQRSGATIVGSAERAPPAWPARNRIEGEALAALPMALTERAVRFLLYQRHCLSDRLNAIARRALDDFDGARQALSELATQAEAWRYLIEGATIVLAGPVNAGKSTLANRLLGGPHALVSDQPGTTRDWVAGTTAIHGVPVTIVDTAGLRTAGDAIEAEGIRRTHDRLATADRVLWVLDATNDSDWPPPPVAAVAPRLIIMNKVDLLSGERRSPTWCAASIAVSAATGDGINALSDAVVASLGLGRVESLEPGLFSERQRRIAGGCLQSPNGRALAERLEAEWLGSPDRSPEGRGIAGYNQSASPLCRASWTQA